MSGPKGSNSGISNGVGTRVGLEGKVAHASRGSDLDPWLSACLDSLLRNARSSKLVVRGTGDSGNLMICDFAKAPLQLKENGGRETFSVSGRRKLEHVVGERPEKLVLLLEVELRLEFLPLLETHPRSTGWAFALNVAI